jgi:hypothetical protein
MQTAVIGAKRLRPNRLLSQIKGNAIIHKMPSACGLDEYNVIFGLGRQNVGAGATVTFTQNAPRDMILRKLIVSGETTADGSDSSITAISVEGNTTLLGGEVSGAAFGPQSFHSPSFDLPVAGGTPVVVTLVNRNAGAQNFAPGFTID